MHTPYSTYPAMETCSTVPANEMKKAECECEKSNFSCDFQHLKLQLLVLPLEKLSEESKKTVARLVDMDSSHLTLDFFSKLPQQ